MTRFSQRALVAAAVATVLLTAALAVALVTSHQRSRSELESAFGQRAGITAALIESAFTQTAQASIDSNRTDFIRPVVTPAIVRRHIQAPGQSILVLDQAGHAIAGWPRTAAVPGRALPPALAGPVHRLLAAPKPGFSIAAPAGTVALLFTFPTSSGRRVVITTYPRVLMQIFLGAYLSRIRSGDGADAFLLDAAGRPLSSGGGLTNTVRHLPTSGSGRLVTARGRQHYASAPVRGTDWTVLVTIPEAHLFAPVNGLSSWLPWGLLVCLVLMAGLVMYLVVGLARGTTRLAHLNEDLQLRNAQIVAADRTKSDFLATMSHELRTPLNGIIGFAELMHDGRVGPVSDRHREYLGDILASSGHLRGLIDDVLDLSKVEAGKIDLRPEQVDCEALIDEVCDVVRSIAVRKQITLTASVAPGLEPLELDPGKLKQVLFNYVSNALKFTPEGGNVTVSAVPEPGDRVRITVADDGPGIAPEDQARLWSAFGQLETGSARRYGGTGLGLSLTRSFVEAQGGEVSVDSELGHGARFHVVLPRVVVAAPAGHPVRV